MCLFLRQSKKDIREGGKRFIDTLSLLQTITCRARTLDTLRPSQIAQVERAGERLFRVRIASGEVKSENRVRTGRAFIHVRSRCRSIPSRLVHQGRYVVDVADGQTGQAGDVRTTGGITLDVETEVREREREEQQPSNSASSVKHKQTSAVPCGCVPCVLLTPCPSHLLPVDP